MMEQKKKVLFVATVVKTHINTFHLPFLKMFKEYGWEVHVAAKNDFVDERAFGHSPHHGDFAVGPHPGDLLGIERQIIPQYPLGGKRSLLDNGVWVQALKRDNVDLTTSPITSIDATGVNTADGRHHEVDVIIYGTGFQASRFLMPMKIRGLGGKDLHETWAGDPRAYLGMTTPGFPNLFMIYGPNTNIVVNGSIIFFSECSVRYIVGCLKLLAETGAGSLEVRREVHDAFNVRVDEGNRLMAWGAPQVTSWYKNEAGRVTQNWPFALVDYWRETLAPNPADFVLHRAAETLQPA